MSIFLYTQPHCGFCTIMKSMLDEIGKKYYTIDISHSYNARKFLKERGHTTVPQVYLNDYHINKNPNTEEITVQDLKEEIEKAEEKLEWPWQDSGIEQTI